MENYVYTIIAMVCLVIMSAYFSATETAFLSLNRIRMKALADEKNKRAALVLRLSDNFDKLISTILIGNNIVNIALSTIATVFFVSLFKTNGATISTVVVTVVVLVFGEITPKGLAKDSADSFALFTAPIIRVIMIVLAPLNFIFTGVKVLMSKIFRTKEIKRDTEQELITIVDEAETEGDIDEEEGELIRSAIEFTDLSAEDILSPRVDFVAIPADATRDEIADAFADSGYSRLPVFDGTLDNIVGVIHHKDFFNRVVRRNTPLSEIIKPPVFITGSMKIFDLLRLLQQTKSHMAFITDEYGGTVGLVTMEDILEELVGDIWDEHDEIVENFIKLEENKYKVLGIAEVEDMFEQFDLEEIDKDEISSSTVSGWLIEQFGTIPSVGDKLSYQNLDFTVLDADAKRILEVEVLVQPKADEEDEDESSSKRRDKE